MLAQQMKHIAQPLEFSFTKETFNLEIESTQDGAQVQAELDQAKADRLHQDHLQRTLNISKVFQNEKTEGSR